MLGFLLFFACRERIALLVCLDWTASMLGFLLLFVAYRAVSFVVELHCCAWILALFLCMQRKNCTAILIFLFYFKMLTKPCHSMERKQCHSLHIWPVQFWEQGYKLSHALFLWFSSVASSSAWSTYNSQTVVWSPAVLKSLMLTELWSQVEMQRILVHTVRDGSSFFVFFLPGNFSL